MKRNRNQSDLGSSLSFVPPPWDPLHGSVLEGSPIVKDGRLERTSLHEHNCESFLAHGFAFGERLLRRLGLTIRGQRTFDFYETARTRYVEIRSVVPRLSPSKHTGFIDGLEPSILEKSIGILFELGPPCLLGLLFQFIGQPSVKNSIMQVDVFEGSVHT